MSSFKDLRVLTQRQKPKGVTGNRHRTDSLSVQFQDRERSSLFYATTRNSFGLQPQGFCERKIHKILKRRHPVSYLFL